MVAARCSASGARCRAIRAMAARIAAPRGIGGERGTGTRRHECRGDGHGPRARASRQPCATAAGRGSAPSEEEQSETSPGYQHGSHGAWVMEQLGQGQSPRELCPDDPRAEREADRSQDQAGQPHRRPGPRHHWTEGSLGRLRLAAHPSESSCRALGSPFLLTVKPVNVSPPSGTGQLLLIGSSADVAPAPLVARLTDLLAARRSQQRECQRVSLARRPAFGDSGRRLRLRCHPE
jgi:hypothetical protein